MRRLRGGLFERCCAEAMRGRYRRGRLGGIGAVSVLLRAGGACGSGRLMRRACLQNGASQSFSGDAEDLAGGAGGGERELHAPYRDGDTRADLEKLLADRAAGGFRKLCASEPDATERAHQHIGKRREPEPQLVRAHCRCGRAVGEHVDLAFLDAVFQLLNIRSKQRPFLPCPHGKAPQ